MKKVCSILFSCALLIGMLGVVALADDAQQITVGDKVYTVEASAPLFTQLTDDDSITHKADENGVIKFDQSGWKAWIAYYDRAGAELLNSGKDLYLYYDFTVNADTNVQFTLNGWGNSVAGLIAEKAGVENGKTDEGNPTLLAGTYTGMLSLKDITVGETGRFGTAGTGAEIRKMAVVAVTEVKDATPEQPEQPEQPTTKEIKIGYKTYTVDASQTLFNGLYTDNGDKVNADENGVITIEQTGWKAWVFETSDELRDFAESEGKKMYLYYDFTVNADTNLQFTLSGWGNSAVAEIAKQAGVTPGATDEGNPTLPAGTYKGMLELTEDLFVGRSGRFGLAGTGAEIRTVEIVSVTNVKDETPSEPENPDKPDDGPNSGEAVPFAMAAAAVTAAAALAFVSRKHK